MKKTLLALSVLAAGSAQAGVNLYDANGVTVDLSGAVEVQYLQNIQDKNSNDDAGLHLDDGDLQLNTTIAVNEQLNVVAGIGFAFEKRDVSNDELWAGFSSDFGTLTFGRQLYITDDAGIGKDYELGTEQISFIETEGDDSIKYVFDNGQFYFGITHDLDAGGDDKTVTDGRIGARFGDFDVRGYYYIGDNVGTVDVEGFNLEAEYVMGQFAFAASYGQVEQDLAGTNTKVEDVDLIEIAGAYTMGKNTFGLGYNRADESVSNETIDNVYANVTHQMHDNVRVYAELGWADGDKTDYDLGYLVGMEVKF